jgi:hypothetical protein
MTKLEIYNAALLHVGQNRVSSVSQPVNLVKALNELYAPVAQTILRQYEWPQAITRTVLTYDDSDTNLTPYGYVYEITALMACLQILDIDDDETIQFLREGDYLYTDQASEDEDTGDYYITLRYIKDISEDLVGATDVLFMPEMLCEVIALRLAIRIAPLAGKMDLVGILEQQYMMALQTAKNYAATDRNATPEDADWWDD